MVIDKPVNILHRAENGEFVKVCRLHASVNKNRGTSYDDAGSERFRYTLSFEFRYNRLLKKIAKDSENYRLEYDGTQFAIADYDDYFEQHRNVKIVGESLGI
jgi:SPP1 family predicted phage head-tail adaptor